MNLNDLNTVYTKSFWKNKKDKQELGEKIFKKKILPKILKAVKKGEQYVEFNTYTKKTDLAVYDYFERNKEFNTERNPHSSEMWPYSSYTISGWKLLKIEPDEILKENL